MRYVEARGRKNALSGTVLLAVVGAVVLGLAVRSVYRGQHVFVPDRWSAIVLLAGAFVLLVVLLRMSIQSLELSIRPLRVGSGSAADEGRPLSPSRPGGLRLVEGGLSAVCTVGTLLALPLTGVSFWALLGSTDRNLSGDHPLLTPILALVGGLTVVALAAAGLGVFRLGRHLARLDGKPEAGGPPDPLRPGDPLQDNGERDETTQWGVGPGGEMICCSGGGIRSASFCMGALQYLVEVGRYQRAKAVFAVSGGSWTASAFHAMHRQFAAEPEGPQEPGAPATPRRPGAEPPELFALSSPELRRFRRDTRYLSSSAGQRLRLALAFAFGTAINLSLVLGALRVGAWFIGWAMAASGTVRPTATTLTTSWDSPLRGGFALLVLSVLTFVLARLIDAILPFAGQSAPSARSWTAPTATHRPSGSGTRAAAVVAGCDRATAPLLLMGVLALLVWPGIPVAGAVLATLGEQLQHLPLISGVVHAVASSMDGPAAVAGVVSAAVAFAGLVRAAVKGQAEPRRAVLLRFLRVQLAPWLGSGLVLGGGYLVVCLWSLDYARAFAESGAPGAGSPAGSPVDGVVLVSAVTVVALSLFTTANFTTIYGFYRDSLADAYLMTRSADQTKAHAMDRRDVPTFSAVGRFVDRDEPVTPALVLCATANVSDRLLVPAGRRATSFLFTSGGIGLPDRQLPERGRRVDPAVYEVGRRRDTSLAAGMAISGAAVAPVAGRESVNVHPYRLLMALANLRLGVWLKNPYWVGDPDPRPQSARGLLTCLVRWLGDVLSAPGPGMILREGLGQTSLYSRYLYVTDGGHLDNLGLVEALRQRPEQLIVLDASADKEDTFVTLANAIATARMDLGVEVNGFNLKSATRGENSSVRQAWTVGHARYPDGRICTIMYIKALYIEDATLDLAGYKSQHEEFPLTGTTDQLYDEFDLEAFRQLGYFVTRKALHGFAELAPNRSTPPVPRPDVQREPVGSR